MAVTVPPSADLKLALTIVAEQEERIARQKDLIRRLEENGLPSSGSRALLGNLQSLLQGIQLRTAKLSNQFEAQ